MNYFKHILFFLVVTTLTFSCKKEDKKNTHVDGKVTDGSSGANISNATIVLRDDNEGVELATTTSDANGNYSFDISGEHSSLSMKVTYTDFYTSPWGTDFRLSLDETFEKRNFTLEIYPTAYAKLIVIKNETIYDNVTFIYFEHTPSGYAGISVSNSSTTSYSYKLVKGGLITSLGYTIRKQIYGPPYLSIDSSASASTFCSPGDTTNLYLTY